MGEEKREIKVTYEQMKQSVDQLQQQNKFLRDKLMEQQHEELYKRIDYLFKVVENAALFAEIDKEFVKTTAVEIMAILTIPEQPAPEQPKEA